MLTLEDRVLRIELLMGIIDRVPDGIIEVERVKQIRQEKGLGLLGAKQECIREYFDKKGAT